MTLDDELRGKEIPKEIKKTLRLIEVDYLSFTGTIEQGHLIVHEALTIEIKEIFASLRAREFPIAKIIPLCKYNWNDDASMTDNNTSAFNYRLIAGTDQLSNHAFGRAIDINPLLNPYTRGEIVLPFGATYDSNRPGTITEDIARLFTDRGWEWGGAWIGRPDWQHFAKN